MFFGEMEHWAQRLQREQTRVQGQFRGLRGAQAGIEGLLKETEAFVKGLQRAKGANLTVARLGQEKQRMKQEYGRILGLMKGLRSVQGEDVGGQESEFLVLKNELGEIKGRLKDLRGGVTEHLHIELGEELRFLAEDNDQMMSQLLYLQEEQDSVKDSLRTLLERMETRENTIEAPCCLTGKQRALLTPKHEAEKFLTTHNNSK